MIFNPTSANRTGTARNLEKGIPETEFSIVDVETTGLDPERHHRIIEIAIIRINLSGTLADHYSTLVNPNRDLGPTHIHHISGCDVKNAPPFEEIAGDVLLRLGGAVFTGFNVRFDLRFLRSEFHRLGHEIPSVEPLCVMRLAGLVAPDLPGRKLEVCCKHFGVPLANVHSAYNDAFATAQLLSQCLARAGRHGPDLLKSLAVEPLPQKHEIWPTIPISGRFLSREDATAATRTQPTYIEKLVASLPSMATIDPKLDEYLALLDQVLEDRLVTADEATLLFNQAQELGFSQDVARSAHSQYMRDLISVAFADGTITAIEEIDLRDVSRLLSIPDEEFQELLLDVKAGKHPNVQEVRHAAAGADTLAGLTICFTGEFICQIKGTAISREYAEMLAEQKGVKVKKGVTKDLDILVTADPNSMSGKAKKARQYGIRIVAEPVFWRMMGVDVE